MDWTWTAVVLVGGAAYLAFAMRRIAERRRRAQTLPLFELANVSSKRMGRLRVRIVDCAFPVDTPITGVVCCAYSFFVTRSLSDGSETLISQCEEASFRAVDASAERMISLRGEWSLDDALGHSRGVSNPEERKAIAERAGSWIGRSELELYESMITIGMTVDVAGELVPEGEGISVWNAMVFDARSLLWPQ